MSSTCVFHTVMLDHFPQSRLPRVPLRAGGFVSALFPLSLSPLDPEDPSTSTKWPLGAGHVCTRRRHAWARGPSCRDTPVSSWGVTDDVGHLCRAASGRRCSALSSEGGSNKGGNWCLSMKKKEIKKRKDKEHFQVPKNSHGD